MIAIVAKRVGASSPMKAASARCEQYAIAVPTASRMLDCVKNIRPAPGGTRLKLKALLKMKMRSGVTPMSIQPAQDWRAQPVSEKASYQGACRSVSEADADILRKRALKRQRALIDTLNGRAPS